MPYAKIDVIGKDGLKAYDVKEKRKNENQCSLLR